MATDRDKNVSCFTLDGVVAEMVIEVEDNQKYDDYKDLASPTKDINSSKEDVSDSKNHDIEIVSENVLSEKREDKENIVDVSETLHMKDKSECEKSVKKERKRKFEENSSHDDDNEKNLDHPRYPGRKRQANKRYISDDMITSIIDSSDNVQTKDTLKDEKKRKVDTDFNDANRVTSLRKSDQNKSEKLALTEGITKEMNIQSLKDKSSDVKEEHHAVSDEKLETEVPKQKILRKLPFRKNKDAPDVPDLKPKVFWWNGVGEGTGVKLGDLPEVRKKIKAAKSSRPLYRVLFYQWPTNGQDIIAQILNFNGFPFDRESYEFTKRQSLLKIMFDRTIGNICDVLGVEKGSKTEMINNILNFLLKPTGKLDPTLDPSMQPVVLLERIELDHKFFQSYGESAISTRSSGRHGSNISTKVKKELPKSSPVTPIRTTRNSLSKLKAAETSSKMSSVKEKDNSKYTPVKTKPSSTKEKDTLEVRGTTRETSLRGTKDSKVSPTGNKSKIARKAKPVDEVQKSVTGKDSSTKVKKVTKLKSKGKKSKHLSKNKVTRKSVDNSPKVEAETKIDEDDEHSTVEENEMKDDDLHEPAVTEEDESGLNKELKLSTEVRSDRFSDSSETESAEESKLATLESPIKSSTRTTHKRKGKPLKMFPEISESIKNANFSALQRLHILLFGASDKAENLKGNILAFGGFPFLEGSDDWKQKHFLLSLLAQNNLREYLKLLCIQYSDDDQPTMINKLMQFLAAPTENAIESKPLETERDIRSPDVKNKEVEVQPKKSALLTKKNVKKKEKKPGRQRKILMSEEEARRLEASFAREQRALARDSRAPVPIIPKPSATESSAHSKQPVTDPRQLNALLQTVYKRRALKAAGAVISTPNKGEKVKLGFIENIKFLIVTANLQDLDVLHQLIYMMPANKSRVRKNILDFDGFGFNEDTEKYKKRMDLLNSLGYGVSKRLSFLLGLCPLHTDIPQQDLNELIMYFLMSPCKSKQVVPITQMPVDPTKLPEEGHVILKPPLEADKISVSQSKIPTVPETSIKSVSETSIESLSPPVVCQKAKKSFSSGQKSATVKKVLLPPATIASPAGKILNFNLKQPVGSTPKSVAVLNPVQAIPTFSIPKASTLNSGTGMSLLNNPVNVAIVNSLKSPEVHPNTTLIKVPVVNPNPKVQIINSPTKAAVLDAATKIPVSNLSPIPGSIVQNQFILPGVSNKLNILPKQNVLPAPVLPGSKMLVRTPSVMPSPQEFLIQQKTPDGKQKTFKLIRLLPNHPLASAVKSPVQQAPQVQQVQQPVIIGTSLSGSTLPPGIVVMKNNSMLQLPGQNLQNILQTVPVKVNLPIKPSSSVMTTSISNSDEFVLPDQGESAGASENDPDIEILNPLEDNPPTDNELYSSIQEIILSSNFEDITLRNVIERVSAQFPHHDLAHRHNFMKDCVKKIIIGT